jgi:thiol-disulfide isomerase/thioredoxin
MNKKSLFVILGLIVIIAGALTYVFVQSSSKTKTTEDTTQQSASDQPITPSQTTPTEVTGKYVPYSAATLAEAQGTILLFFHASWCPQCREIERTINEDGVPNDVTVLKVDYDSNQALRQKYGVTLQTTFVKVDKEGNKLASYVAYEEPTFDAVKRELLQ